MHLQANNRSNDLSILKSIKLMFFFSTVSDDGTEALIDNQYNIYAMPLGHVESDIYDAVKCDSFKYFTFNKHQTFLKTDFVNIDSFSKEVTQKVDERFGILLDKNPDIICTSSN